MKARYGMTLGLSCVLLSGCASLNFLDPLPTSTAVSQESGYIYGSFKLERTGILLTRVLVRIEEVNTKLTAELVLRDIGNQVYAVPVAPGNYRVKEFVFARGGPPAMLAATDVSAWAVPSEWNYLTRATRIDAGKAYYLGDFEGECTMWSGPDPRGMSVTYFGKCRKVTQNFEKTTSELKRLYPTFANVGCVPMFSADAQAR